MILPALPPNPPLQHAADMPSAQTKIARVAARGIEDTPGGEGWVRELARKIMAMGLVRVQ